MKRAIYRWGRDFGAVWIVDLDEAGAASVTNDAERVIADLVGWGVVPDAQPIIYRDSMGQWDRILTAGGIFAGIQTLGGARSLQEAVARLPAGSTAWQ